MHNPNYGKMVQVEKLLKVSCIAWKTNVSNRWVRRSASQHKSLEFMVQKKMINHLRLCIVLSSRHVPGKSIGQCMADFDAPPAGQDFHHLWNDLNLLRCDYFDSMCFELMLSVQTRANDQFEFQRVNWNQDTWRQVVDGTNRMANHQLFVQGVRARMVEDWLRCAIRLATWQANCCSGAVGHPGKVTLTMMVPEDSSPSGLVPPTAIRCLA